VVLRSEADLAKFDPFWGLANVSLAKLDLREQKAALEKTPFDSRTVWPPRDKLAKGFDPVRQLEEGKNPGLGVRGLQAQGLDGRGIGIAIIDQPLLQNHAEYAERLVRYEPIDVARMGPQMHGSPVCSIAWQAAVAKAARNGILVVTCDPMFPRLGTLKRDPLEDPNDPAPYRPARYSAPCAALWVPVGNRTMASHAGPSVYTYDVEGGMSWGMTYLAGLAALAFQIDPDIPPAQIVELWTATAPKTAVGPVVNPPKFIEAVRSRPAVKRRPDCCPENACRRGFWIRPYRWAGLRDEVRASRTGSTHFSFGTS
jgi:hypothetical protein